ncbi:hypothetical protein ACTPEM_25070, partial [Clostridioides difficile]
PTATMIIHPVRTTGLVIGINETFEYFKKMQDRIIQFIIRTSNFINPMTNKIKPLNQDKFKFTFLTNIFPSKQPSNTAIIFDIKE